MAKYLFSHYSVEGEPRPAMTDEDMQGFMKGIFELEAGDEVGGRVVLRRRSPWSRTPRPSCACRKETC